MSDETDIDLPDTGKKQVLRKHEVQDDFSYPVTCKMGFVGVGQGGGRIAETFYHLGYRRVAVINSAKEDLSSLDPAIHVLDFGTGGAGQNMELGQQFMADRQEEVLDLLERTMGEDLDFLNICVSFGGGTGGGGASQLIKCCRQYMSSIDRNPSRVGVFGSLPVPYEGQRTCRNAVHAFNAVLKMNPTPFVVVDNKRIAELYECGSTEFFKRCNDQVCRLFHLFNRYSQIEDGLITFDEADYHTLLDSGIVTFGAALVDKYESKADLTESIRNSWSESVLAQVDAASAKAAGCVFMGGKSVMEVIPMDWFGHAFKMLNRAIANGGDAPLYRGVYVGKADDLRCYTVLAGLKPPVERLQELAREGRIAQVQSTLGIADQLGVGDAKN